MGNLVPDAELRFRKSSYSDLNNCVEVARFKRGPLSATPSTASSDTWCSTPQSGRRSSPRSRTTNSETPRGPGLAGTSRNLFPPPCCPLWDQRKSLRHPPATA